MCYHIHHNVLNNIEWLIVSKAFEWLIKLPAANFLLSIESVLLLHRSSMGMSVEYLVFTSKPILNIASYIIWHDIVFKSRINHTLEDLWEGWTNMYGHVVYTYYKRLCDSQCLIHSIYQTLCITV